jgi:tetratricopeptide (TPR) repeat protein
MFSNLLLTGLISLLTVMQAQQGRTQPSPAEAAFNHAMELQQQSSWPEAAAAWRQFLELEPRHAGAHVNLGAVLARMEQYDEAIGNYQEALRLDPSLTQVLFNIGVAHYRAGHYEQAAEVLGHFLNTSPNSWQAKQMRGLALVELGRDDQAEPLLAEALTDNPDDLSLLFGLGLTYLRLNKPQVKDIIEKLASTAPGLPFAHLLKGQSYLANTDYQHAAESLEAAERLSDDLPRLHFSLGVAYLHLGRNADAMSQFEREARRLPRDYWTLYYEAFLYEAKGQLDRASERVRLALEVQPQSSDANALLGKVLLKQGKAADAVGPLAAAVAQNPRDANLRFQLARAYQQAGRKEEAAREFAEAQRLKDDAIERERKGSARP